MKLQPIISKILYKVFLTFLICFFILSLTTFYSCKDEYYGVEITTISIKVIEPSDLDFRVGKSITLEAGYTTVGDAYTPSEQYSWSGTDPNGSKFFGPASLKRYSFTPSIPGEYLIELYISVQTREGDGFDSKSDTFAFTASP